MLNLSVSYETIDGKGIDDLFFFNSTSILSSIFVLSSFCFSLYFIANLVIKISLLAITSLSFLRKFYFEAISYAY